MKNLSFFFESCRFCKIARATFTTSLFLLSLSLMGFSIYDKNFYCSSNFDMHSSVCFDISIIETEEICNASFYIKPLEDLACIIDSVTVISRETCDDNNTTDFNDDFSFSKVEIGYNDKPSSGVLRLTSPLFYDPADVYEIDVQTLPDSGVYVFDSVKFQAVNGADFDVTVEFTDPVDGCILHNPDAGWEWSPVNHPGNTVATWSQCSVCPCSPICKTDYRDCWPEEDPSNINSPCDDFTNYGPDPDFPEHIPIKYIRVVLHFLQREDPFNPGQIHPTDPGNYNAQDHMGIIQSWFTDPDGVDKQWSQLCQDPNITPYIADARMRVVNTGTEGYDVFFHPDSRAGLNLGGGLISDYVTNPDSTMLDSTYFQSLNDPEIINAHHIFIDIDRGPGNCTGGGTVLDQFCNGNNAVTSPASLIFGNYKLFLTQGDSTMECGDEYPGSDAALGQKILGEVYHLLGG